MINIAIDGPAGAGKSTVAKAVAKDLGIIYLDTGAMYRATAYYVMSKGIDVKDEESIKKVFEDFDMDIFYEDGVQQIVVNGINTTPFLREHYMSKAASDISALPTVRYKMVDIQRAFAKTHDVVLDGRDIGTFVLPDANCKFYVTATAEERANRRYQELKQKGSEMTYEEILDDINKRDYNDSHREVAPLKQAEDAVYIDTTSMTIDDVVKMVKDIVSSKCQDANSPKQNKENLHKPVPSSEMDKKTLERIKSYYKPVKSYALYRFLRVVLRPLQAMLWPTKVVGKEKMEGLEGALLICNHYSKVDALIPCAHLFKKEAHILAKYELFRVPIAGWFLHTMGSIPVRRGEADVEAVKQVLRVLKSNKQLLLFPEGTRNFEGTQELGEIKSGTARFAIKTRVPIVPMIYYACPKVFKKNWLYIGEPFTLEEYYGTKGTDHLATKKVREMMEKTRKECNEYVESLKK